MSGFVNGPVSGLVSGIASDCPGLPLRYSDSPRSPINHSYVRIFMTLRDNHEAPSGEIR
jgi:hypothetical protein